MEAAAAFGRARPSVKTEKPAGGDRDGDGDGDSDSTKYHLLVKMGNYGKQEHENEDKSSVSDQKDLSCTKLLQEDQLESARAEMGEVREENQRLKMSLTRIMKDYETLRMRFMGIAGRDAKNLPTDDKSNEHGKEMEETELVSLTLGRFPADKKKDDKDQKSHQGQESSEQAVKETLSLGLNCKFEEETTTAKATNSPNHSLTNSLDHVAKEEAGEATWPPSKSLKTMRSEDDEVTPQNPPKRARVCVRARCETATMNDGCQWRKYGQKIAKGNPCPRAYYRCTGSPTCPVRKQVQRCADDMSILITTYEGNHNHPLPVSATAMASTTSAAASMLLSGSSSSNSATVTAPNSSSSSSPTNLHGLNFYLSGNSNSKHFYLPNSSISSTSPTHPTITLDLTSNAPSSSSSHFSKFSSSSFTNPRYPFTSQLDFGSSRNNVLSWNNGLLSYANQAYNRNNPNSNIFQNYMQRNTVNSLPTASTTQQALPDTIAAATKAITADPSFQSALAAALTSIIGTGGGSAGGAVGGQGGSLIGDKLKSSSRGDQPFQLSAFGHQTAKGNGCGTSFLSNIAAASTNSSPPAGNMVFVPSNSLPFSTSKSASASPGDHIDLTN